MQKGKPTQESAGEECIWDESQRQKKAEENSSALHGGWKFAGTGVKDGERGGLWEKRRKG